ncbi:DUF2235 domain-containing protein [Massilia sp. YIM B02443]|uniref:T6SS phospholipase effector Tle1-like catalytic domain-containing protein n=1 Tax=Massilia sp. YIM B02443 TaxID=3050127 RepID=UPI0025B6A854|nr:DUF2235 domain-containing protein [Massilia sp. YIM B02443]MDN4036296.1 DUF2235 domain-containing protein [Massilia sp. YIM B02443]
MSRETISASPTKLAPVSDMKIVVPKVSCDVKSCQVTLNIGLFFDGTNNNMYRDLPHLADTNIARLFRSYIDRRKDGYERVYIPGVGTSFPEIGEDGESKLGTGWAFGCEGRVVFGLLSVFNFLSYRTMKNYLFDEKTVLGLCRNRSLFTGVADREHLAKFDMDMSLVTGAAEGVNIRHLFLRQQSDLLEAKLKNYKPHIAECFIDVFGFSRGAAEARVFCNWLNDLLVNGRLAGVPLQFRFLGIIDTVASAGFWSGTTALIKNSTGGHGSWASAKSLRVPNSVQNCLHMVAMHELRRNFPLDAFGSKDRMSSGWVQYAYPGAHSDVGGGYRPGELGLAVDDDSKKLSQIPLNHMFDCAVAAGVPLKKTVTQL